MNSQMARQRIMARLHASGTEKTIVPESTLPKDLSLDPEARIARLAEMMTAMRTEVHIVAADGWTDTLKEIARKRGWKHLLYGPGSPIASAIETAWASDTKTLPRLKRYTEPVETFKSDLFRIDAGITSVRGGVADTGALVLWPDEHEPRLMSLVPPGACGRVGCRYDLQFHGRDDGQRALGRRHAHQCPYDFRSVQDRRYRVHPGVWCSWA